MELDKTKLVVGIFVALSLVLGGAYYFESQENIFYCESRDLVGFCDKLSSGIGTRCYFNQTYKTCSEGWANIAGIIDLQSDSIQDENPSIKPPSTSSEGIKWICSTIECKEIQ